MSTQTELQQKLQQKLKLQRTQRTNTPVKSEIGGCGGGIVGDIAGEISNVKTQGDLNRAMEKVKELIGALPQDMQGVVIDQVTASFPAAQGGAIRKMMRDQFGIVTQKKKQRGSRTIKVGKREMTKEEKQAVDKSWDIKPFEQAQSTKMPGYRKRGKGKGKYFKGKRAKARSEKRAKAAEAIEKAKVAAEAVEKAKAADAKVEVDDDFVTVTTNGDVERQVIDPVTKKQRSRFTVMDEPTIS